MDTIRYKLDVPLTNERMKFFCEKIQHKEIINDPINKGSSRFVLTANNWRKERIKKEIYTPKFWFQENFLYPSIKEFWIEYSVPKLLSGHNAINLKNDDKMPSVEAVQKFLQEIGIENVFARRILDVMPSLVSFGINSDITDLCSCQQAISILSLFDDRFRSESHIIKPKYGGIELYFNTKSSTFKSYAKLPEMKNNAVTPEEKKFVGAYLQKGYGEKEIWICEILRTELTLKGTDSIRKRLNPYCGDKITFENMFDEKIWFDLLKNEVERVFAHPLKEFVFLSTLQSPAIEAILDKNIKHMDKRLRIKNTIEKIQKAGGVKGVKNYYFKNYGSRQTFYNHIKIIREIMDNINPSEVENLTASKIHKHFLSQFGLENPLQNSML